MLQVNLLDLIKSSHVAWMRTSGSAAPLWSTQNLLLGLCPRLPGDSSACSVQPFWLVWHASCLFSPSFLAMLGVMWLSNPHISFLGHQKACIVLERPLWTCAPLACYEVAGRLSRLNAVPHELSSVHRVLWKAAALLGSRNAHS